MSHAQVHHAIRAELLIDELGVSESIQLVDSLIAQQRKLQIELLQAVKDAQQRQLLASVLQSNETSLRVLQHVLLGLQSIRGQFSAVKSISQGQPQEPIQQALATYTRLVDELEWAVRTSSLMVEPVLVPSRLPLLGRLVNKLKGAFHNLVVFYVNRLAERQARVNSIYGELVKALVLDLKEHRRLPAEPRGETGSEAP